MQPAASLSATRTSAWSYVSWAFFALAVVAVALGVASLAASGQVADEPYVGTVFSLGFLLGAGFSWIAALACAALGALLGAVGLVRPTARSGPAWAAMASNAGLLAAGLVLLQLLG